MSLKGKVALITGASGDIGGAIARALIVQGCDIAGTYVGNEEGISKLCADVEAAGCKALAVKVAARAARNVFVHESNMWAGCGR